MKNDLMEFGERLVKLHNGAQGLRSGLSVKATAVEGTAPVIRFVSSDETLDRYNEIISASGWVLDNYLRNPVFQDSHDYSSVIRTIGKAQSTVVTNGQLVQDVVFAVNDNPLAKLAYSLYKGGFLHAVSVGFIPMEWQSGDNGTAFNRKYLKQELLETSAVSIPANPNALAAAYKSGAVEKGDLKELGAMLKHFGVELATDGTRMEHGFLGGESEKTCPGCESKLSIVTESAGSEPSLVCIRCGHREAPAEGERNAVDRRSILQDPQLLKMFRETAALCKRC